MTGDPYYDAGYAFGQVFGAVACLVLVIGAAVTIIVVAVKSSRKQNANAARTSPWGQADLQLEPGEVAGPLWPAVHPSGTPMTATITSRGELVIAYNTQGSTAIRLRKSGLTAVVGTVHAPPPGWPEALADLTIASSDYAAFTVSVVESGARQISSWASA